MNNLHANLIVYLSTPNGWTTRFHVLDHCSGREIEMNLKVNLVFSGHVGHIHRIIDSQWPL